MGVVVDLRLQLPARLVLGRLDFAGVVAVDALGCRHHPLLADALRLLQPRVDFEYFAVDGQVLLALGEPLAGVGFGEVGGAGEAGAGAQGVLGSGVVGLAGVDLLFEGVLHVCLYFGEDGLVAGGDLVQFLLDGLQILTFILLGGLQLVVDLLQLLRPFSLELLLHLLQPLLLLRLSLLLVQQERRLLYLGGVLPVSHSSICRLLRSPRRLPSPGPSPTVIMLEMGLSLLLRLDTRLYSVILINITG